MTISSHGGAAVGERPKCGVDAFGLLRVGVLCGDDQEYPNGDEYHAAGHAADLSQPHDDPAGRAEASERRCF